MAQANRKCRECSPEPLALHLHVIVETFPDSITSNYPVCGKPACSESGKSNWALNATRSVFCLCVMCKVKKRRGNGKNEGRWAGG